MTTDRLAHIRDEHGKLPRYAWPGGYPVFYLCDDDSVLCAACANGENGSETNRPDLDAACLDDHQWILTAHDINWEDPDLYCGHCNNRIESAYADERPRSRA